MLIESADHDADLVTYEPDELHHVMRFALGCWQQMIDSQQYRSVLMYKNKGPLGSLVHPHMQIVGLEQEDGYASLTSANFEGIMSGNRGESRSTSQPNRSWGSLRSTFQPRKLPAMTHENQLRRIFAVMYPGSSALYPERAPRWSRRVVQRFFYHLGGRTIAKALPRWVVSPYFCWLSFGPGQCRDNA